MYALWTTNWTTSDYYSTTTSAVFLCSTMAQQQRPTQLDRLTCYRVDRVLIDGGKACGGRLCGHQWQHQWQLVLWRCCGLLLWSTAHPLWNLLLSSAGHTIFQGNVLLDAVYITPTSNDNNNNNNSNRSEALTQLHHCISDQQTAHPDAFLILMHFSSWLEISTTQSQRLFFPKYTNINFPTRRNNRMDLVYTSQTGAYKTIPLPHLGTSDHITVGNLFFSLIR